MTIVSGTTGSFFNSTQGMSGMRPQRHDPSKLVDEIFAKLDTKGQGYLEKSDLQSAFENSSSSNSASIDEVFASLDGDGDGKITKDEMSSGLKKLAEELDNQFNADRMAQAMGNMPPPPPPPENDTGFSKDELTQQLSDATAAGDTKRADLLTAIIGNFDKADSDGDGKVSFKEAMAYDQSRQSGSSSSTSTTDTTATTSSSDSESLSARVLRQMMRLMASYGAPESTAATSSLSISA